LIGNGHVCYVGVFCEFPLFEKYSTGLPTWFMYTVEDDDDNNNNNTRIATIHCSNMLK